MDEGSSADAPEPEPVSGEPEGEARVVDGGDPASESTPENTPEGAASVVRGHGAPPVVAVVVTKDPGTWFEEVLSSLEAQDYPQLSILVVDNGGKVDPTERIADVAPFAFVKRLDEDQGFSSAVNEAVGSVEGAPFLLVCHDDVVLEPDAVTELVAEAFRSNSGVVGPKLRDAAHPGQLSSVGLSVDRYGAARELVDDGELDQSQHDISRDLFAVTDACVLVRADLFDTVDGFSEAIPFFGEDIDLCWKVHLAGAKVRYCHRAVAYHRRRFAERRSTDAEDRLELRHQARMTLASHDAASLVRIVPAAFFSSLAELVASVVVGRGRVAVDILATWLWVLTHPLAILRARRARKAFRRTGESDWSPLQRRGSNRMRILGVETSEENRILAAGRAGRERIRSAAADVGESRLAVALAVLVPVLVLFGSRDLWFGDLPSMREFTTLGDSVGNLWSQWWNGWRPPGLGEPSIGPYAVPGLGLLGTLLLYSAGAARRVLLLAPFVLAPLGAWRLLPRGSSMRARAGLLAAYSLSPIVLNAMGEARLQALVAWAAAPWVLRRVCRHSGVEPFARADFAPEGDLRDYAGTALVLGLVAAISPLAALIVFVAVLLLLVGPALTGQGAGALGAARHLLVAVIGAALLNLPWIIAVVRHGDLASMFGIWKGRSPVPTAAQMLTGSTGDLRTGLLGWGLVVVAAVPLLTGRGWRLGWSAGAWFAIAGGLAGAVFAGSSDWLAGAGVEALLVPVSLGLAIAVAMAALAFENDVVRSDFGTPQIASFIGAVALLVALVPQVLASTEGRWYLPSGDFDRALSVVDDGDDFRSLWIGDADVLPLAGWSLASVPGVNLGFAEGLDPTMSLRWRLDGGESVEATSEALTAALEGRTARLGRGISPMAIRYVVVVDRPAPEPFADSEVPMPAGVVDALEEQLDLTRILVGPGIELFRVSAAWPPRSDITEVPGPGEVPEGVLGEGFGTAFSGELAEDSEVAQAVTADPGWRLEVDGRETERGTLFAWGQRFAVQGGGDATLSFNPPLSRRVEQVWELLALAALVLVASRRTSVPTPRRRRVIAAQEPLVVLDGPGESPEDWSPTVTTDVDVGDTDSPGDPEQDGVQ
ncbi:MAG: glycosyltransferase family 2 protein [Microthrixaceae bacterium]